MSFRYTNNLIGAIRHRLSLEAAHREIVRRTFMGTCNGIEVTCSGYGTVLSIRLLDKKTWEPFYRRPSGAGVTDAGKESTPTTAADTADGLDYKKLSQSIQTATWEANRLLRAAKEEALARSLLHNPQLRARGTLRTWYESDADTLHPRPFDALRQEAVTPWMQAVRFAKANARSYLGGGAAPAAALPPPPAGTRPRVSVLDAADCDPLAIPVGATHPLYTPALVQLEASGEAAGAGTVLVTGQPNLSRVRAQAVLAEYKKEMARDEELFWERVELIRRAQLAAIPNGASKRVYADMASTVTDSLEEKVDLKFTQ